MAMADEEARVLSIQSHVVCGTVGNRSIVFPMQLLGFEVDFVNSVQFSNHTWYPTVKGQVLDAAQLQELYDGLTANKLDGYAYLMTGYAGSTSFLDKLCDIVRDQKARNPNLLYVCDPVMGDRGVMYVPEALLPIYREKVVPLADVVIPNQFEAELLSERKIGSEADALEVIEYFHGRGVATVVLSSTELGDDAVLIGYASRRLPDGRHARVRMRIPRVDTNFVGTGDLFSALLVAWLHRHPHDLKLACRKVIGTMQAVLRQTFQRALARLPAGAQPTVGDVELRLVGCKDAIENPPLHDGVEEFE